MLEKILKIKKETGFDFREFAKPDDELAYLFDEWVDYYKLKYAICRAVEPKSILEIGVRYGYSALSFLKAAEDASYVGLDNDSSAFGGSVGAINWAKKITTGYNAQFLLADTQKFTALPGSYYDLIHIDGQQDGDGTFHDMEMALEKGRYILVDGYFWSRENLLSSTFFLEKYRNFIEYAIIMPGYAGEILIKTRENAKNIFSNHDKRNHESLNDCYDKDYYLRDCGGYDSFLRSGGLELHDSRYIEAYLLANPKEGQNILDLGCGRGELSYALSRTGANVIGIDYSADAINIAEKTFAESKRNLKFLSCDFMNYEPKEKFDTIVTADVVEHVDQHALERLLSKSSSILRQDGNLIISTAPNKLNYLYEYGRKRRKAREAGLYLPKNPRTFYEDLMHINEQTPAKLTRALKKHFKYVVTWAQTPPDMIGSLDKTHLKDEFLKATAIFSIASNTAIDKEKALSLLTQQKLEVANTNIEMKSGTDKLTMKISEKRKVVVTLHNRGKERVVSLPPYPVNIAYHWYSLENDRIEVFDGVRTPIRLPLLPSEKRDFYVDVHAPDRQGAYRLELTLVQESNFWFEQVFKEFPLAVRVDIA